MYVFKYLDEDGGEAIIFRMTFLIKLIPIKKMGQFRPISLMTNKGIDRKEKIR
jgi:hypothetical protein